MPELPYDLFYHPGKRSLVRVSASLVSKAQSNCNGSWGRGNSVHYQGFILAAGAEVYLLAGLLGLGLGYLLTRSNRLPRIGEPTKVFPHRGKPYLGPWEGLDGNGTMYVGDRYFDHKHIGMAGPVKSMRSGRSYVDLRNGFVDPDELAKLRKAHNRDGYRKRKGRS